jgi:hypothetical protein
VTITDNSGCSVTSSATITSGCPFIIPANNEPDKKQPGDNNGISDLNNTDITVYPNPSTGQFTIAGVEAGMIVEIYDYTGRRISTISASNNKLQLNIADQSNGIYLIRILSRDGNFVSEKKLVKTQ